MKGSVSTKIKTGGGLDPESGEPIPVTYTFGEASECQYRASVLSNEGAYLDGTFQSASFIITTDDMNFSETASVVKLTNSRGVDVCTKEVISLEVLEDIQRVKIMI